MIIPVLTIHLKIKRLECKALQKEHGCPFSYFLSSLTRISSPCSKVFCLPPKKYSPPHTKIFFFLFKNICLLLLTKISFPCPNIFCLSPKRTSPLSQRFPLLFPPETIMIIMPETDQQHSQGRNPHV